MKEALSEAQIVEILGTIQAKFKSAQNKRPRTIPGPDSVDKDDECEIYEYADWGKLYKEAYESAEEVEVHADGDYPKKLLNQTYPNESLEERRYIRGTFQPITKPFWHKALRSLNRIFGESNFSIDFSDDAVKQYFTKDMPVHGNIISYFKQVLKIKKINDPNGVLVVDFDMPVRETAEGELIADQSKEIEPFPTIYECEDVLMFESGEYGLFMSEEKSVVEWNGKKQNVGYVMYLYDCNTIYRIYQIGKKIDWQFEADVYYEHNLGLMPAWKLKGIPCEVFDDEVLYESHFSPAIPHLNDAIVMNRNLRASITKIAYPIRTYYEQPCTNGDCRDGKIMGQDGNANTCSTCGGTGRLKFSPLRDYVMQKPDNILDDSSQPSPFPAIGYVSPDPTILTFSKETIYEMIDQAFSFLNIENAPNGMKKGLGGDATATKSKIDYDEMFVSILDISDEIFDLLGKWLTCAYMIRYNATESQIKISPPRTFELLGSAELTQELVDAKQGNVPDSYMNKLTKDLIDKRFPQDASMIRKYEIGMACDPLFTKDAADIQIMRPDLERWVIVLHNFFDYFLGLACEEMDDFIYQDMDKIREKLETMAKDKTAELDAASGGTAADIMKKIGNGGGSSSAK